MHYAIQDFVHKTLGTRLVPDYGHALRGFMHNDLMHCENFICIHILTLGITFYNSLMVVRFFFLKMAENGCVESKYQFTP